MSALESLRAGAAIVLPTDTVYGIAALAKLEAGVARLSELKQRDPGRPIALLGADVEMVLRAVPELPEAALRALLPGPYTLVLPNPAQRFPWLAGANPGTLGVRVPALPPEAAALVREAGCVAATSANLHGGPDPRSVDAIPAALLAGVAAVVDAGELPGTPSTVVDLTGEEPRILREGAIPAAAVLSTIRAWPPSSTASSS